MIHIEYRFAADLYDVYVARVESEDSIRYLSIDGDGIQVWSAPQCRWEYNPTLKPTFQIPGRLAPELIAELQKQGVKTPALSKIERLYEAQGKHLADLQSILRSKGDL